MTTYDMKRKDEISKKILISWWVLKEKSKKHLNKFENKKERKIKLKQKQNKAFCLSVFRLFKP